MEAFHGKQKIKDKFVVNAKWHQDMDKFVQGQGRYDEEQKGCMISCSFHNYDHGLAPTEAGVPVWLAKLADRIFEGLSKKESDLWTLRFWEAINVGANLENVKEPFLIFVLKSTFDTFDYEKYPNVKKSIDDVISLYESGETDLNKFRETRKNAAAAAYAAAYAADAAAATDAAYTAVAAAAYAAVNVVAAATDAAANAAADAAADAAAIYAAYIAAASAADAANAAAATDAAANAAAVYAAYIAAAAYAADVRKDRYKMFADKLIELMKAEVQSGGPHG